MGKTLFDRLPVELFDEIFLYLSSDEILDSFFGLSEYLNGVIENYQNYFLDFSSSNMRQREFDLICSKISPKQIVGLKVSKGRFNLIDQYLNGMNSEKYFPRVRSLWLDEKVLFNEISSRWINSIIDYNNLRSFRFDSVDKLVFIKRLNCEFENLRRLIGCSSHLFRRLSKEIPTHLTCLQMFFTSIDDVKCFLSPNAHQLKSLRIIIKCHPDQIDQFSSLFNQYQWKHLIQFSLNLEELNNVSWRTMEEILSPMSQLKDLTLVFSKQIWTNSRLFDGNVWQKFLSMSLPHAKKFSLKLPMKERCEDGMRQSVRTFQTSWWENIKQWFIEYDSQENALVTVADYSSKIFNTFTFCSLHSDINRTFFYSNITELKLNLIESNLDDEVAIATDGDRPYFCHIRRLSLNGCLRRTIAHRIRHYIDLRRIEHFQIVSAADDLHEFAQLILDMSNLFSLDIQCVHSLRLFRLILSPLASVRRLTLIGSEATTIKRVYFEVHRLFAHLSVLTSEYHSQEILSYLLNNFYHLEEVNLRLNHYDHVPDHRWIEEHTRLISDSFQSDVFNVNYKEKFFLLWINQDKNFDRSIPQKHRKCPIQ